MLELSLGVCLVIVFIAFFCEYVDSTLGGGYGTILTPVLLFFGFAPIQVVPVVLLSELVTGFLAAFFHHKEGNVNLKPKSTNVFKIMQKLKALGYIESFNRGVPKHLQVALLLGICSVLGTVFAVFVAVTLPKFWVKLSIGFIVFLMGVIVLVLRNNEFKFSWRKVTFLGLVASFNKGLSGGGYGPLVTSGQILSGVESKSAVGITSFAEGLTCLVGVIAYFLSSRDPFAWNLALVVTTGAVLSVPLSAKSVKVINVRWLKFGIAVLSIALGGYTIIRTLQGV